MGTTAHHTERTTVLNSFHGWEATTDTTDNGKGWKITTMKRHSGQITSIARKGEYNNGNFSFMMIGGESKTLLSEKATATEKTIRTLHAKALLLFDEQVPQEAEQYEIKVGQRVFLDGYGKGQTDGNAIIYAIKKDNWGTTFLTVDTDTLELSSCSHLRPFSEKFGIGTYYIENDVFKGSQNDLNNIVIEAQVKAKAKAEAETKRREEAKAERERKIEEGKKLVNIPTWAESVIVADCYQNNSDSMTDYFHTSVNKTAILAFSKHKRNNIQELQKACLNWEVSTELLNKEDNEHTKGHSYLPDYYIGSSSWSGWKVNKRKYGIDPKTEEGKNFIYLAAAEGLFFANVETAEAKETPNFEAVEVPAGQIQIIDYSEKAIAVIGETKPIKDKLKELGGRFNFRLTCGAGWIFPKTKLSEIEALFS